MPCTLCVRERLSAPIRRSVTWSCGTCSTIVIGCEGRDGHAAGDQNTDYAAHYIFLEIPFIALNTLTNFIFHGTSLITRASIRYSVLFGSDVYYIKKSVARSL